MLHGRAGLLERRGAVRKVAMDEDGSPPVTRRLVSISELSPADFGRLGLGYIAYVRPILVNGLAAFAIHAADGTQMAVAPEHAVAIAAIRQHEMEPLPLH
jgi:hypothetical protein